MIYRSRTLTLGSPSDRSIAKKYNRIKLILGITSGVISFLIVLAIVAFGFSVDLRDWILTLTADDYSAVVLFLIAVGIIDLVVTSPIGFYSSYVIEHRYNLSNQTPGRWVWERLKSMLGSGCFKTIVIA